MALLWLQAMQISWSRKGWEKVAVRDVGATSCQVQDSSSQSEMSQVPSGDRVTWGDAEKSGNLMGPAF